MAGWPSIRILLTLVSLEEWKTIQVDFFQAFPQATIDKDIYLKLPSGFQVENGDNDDYTLKIRRNIYDKNNLEGSGISI